MSFADITIKQSQGKIKNPGLKQERTGEALQKTRPLLRAVMTWLIGGALLWESLLMLNIFKATPWDHWIRYGELLLLGYSLMAIPPRRTPWYGVLMAFVLWLFVSSAIRGDAVLDAAKIPLSRAVAVCLLCPALPLLLPKKDLKRLLTLFLAVWTALGAVLAGAGLICAWTGTRIGNFNGKNFIGLNSAGQLRLMVNTTLVSSVHLAVTLALAVTGLALTRPWPGKIAYGLAAVTVVLAQAMMVSRTGPWTTAAILGLAAGLSALPFLRKRISNQAVRLLLILLLTAAVAAGVFFAFSALQPQLISPKKGTVADQEWDTLRVIWTETFSAFGREPSLLLTGTAVPNWKEELTKLCAFPEENSPRNLLLDCLITAGLPGLLLFGAFLFFLVRAALRLLRKKETPLWQLFLTLPAAFAFLLESVENQTRLQSRAWIAIPLMAICGAVLRAAGPDEDRR